MVLASRKCMCVDLYCSSGRGFSFVLSAGSHLEGIRKYVVYEEWVSLPSSQGCTTAGEARRIPRTLRCRPLCLRVVRKVGWSHISTTHFAVLLFRGLLVCGGLTSCDHDVEYTDVSGVHYSC